MSYKHNKGAFPSAEFLSHYERTGGDSAEAARQVGRSFGEYLREREKNALLNAGVAIVDLRLMVSLEAHAWRLARYGVLQPIFQGGLEVGSVQKYSEKLIQFLLTKRLPERYGDNVIPKDQNPQEFARQLTRLINEAQKTIPLTPARSNNGDSNGNGNGHKDISCLPR